MTRLYNCKGFAFTLGVQGSIPVAKICPHSVTPLSKEQVLTAQVNSTFHQIVVVKIVPGILLGIRQLRRCTAENIVVVLELIGR